MTYDVSEYDQEAIDDLEGENADLRAQNERLQKALAAAVQEPTRSNPEDDAASAAAAKEAEWLAKIEAATSPQEVMAVHSARLATLNNEPTPDQQREILNKHNAALGEVNSMEEAMKLDSEFRAAHRWAS